MLVAFDVRSWVVPMELGSVAFQARDTIAVKLGIVGQRAAYRSDRSFPTQLPITLTNKRASLEEVKVNLSYA